jgi:hypothetical protein
MLAPHHTFVVLQHKRIVRHPLKVFKVPSFQSVGQSIIQTIQETLMLLLISVNLIGSIAKQLGKPGDVLIHRYGSLFQVLEFLILELDHTLGNMVSMKGNSKRRPIDTLKFFISLYIDIPLVACRS